MEDLGSFVDVVPQPLTHALVLLSPIITTTARLVVDGEWWVVVGLWWVLCLVGPIIPLIIIIIFFFTQQPPTLVTETLLQNVITDLTLLATALPTQPSLSLHPHPPALLLSIPCFLFLFTYILPTQILFAILGSLFLIRRAPWARLLYALLQKSAFLRHAFLTGIPPSNQPTTTPVPSLRFLFTIYENQRWWVGLDWTAALLPSERPSWSSSSLTPVSPPTTFSLPDPSTVYLPHSNSRIKRTATWRWDDPEWRLLLRKEGESSIDDSIPPSATTRLFKPIFKDLSSSTQNPPLSPPQPDSSFIIDHHSSIRDDSAEPLTDPDGWIYADNKWENQSHRGGLGKYTRYRRWTRVAVVTELVEILPPGSTGVQIKSDDNHLSPTDKLINLSLSDSKPQLQSQSPELSPISAAIGTSTPTPSSSTSMINNNNTPEPESPLRQRLRAALSKSSSSIPVP